MWFTAIRGIFSAKAIDLAKELPTNKEPIKPGPCVKAMADNCSLEILAFFKAASITGTIFCWCAREASSGTTPPYWV